MATLTTSYREGTFATIAAADTGLDTWLNALNARIIVLTGGTAATRSYGTLTFSVKCENAGATEYTFRMSITFDTDVVAAGTALTHSQTVVTALAALATAAEGASAYTTVTDVEAQGNITMVG
jgi:hypothetical protein